MDAPLVHLLTTVCGYNDTKDAYKAVVHAGIDTVDDFLAHGYQTPFVYDESGTVKAVHSSSQTKLSQLIAYAIDLNEKKDANARNFSTYSKDAFNKWRVYEYPTWVSKQKAKASSVSTNPFATNSREKFELETFVKTQKLIADYPLLKDEDAWYTFKTDFERVAKNHEFHRLLTSTHETKKDFLASLVADSLDAQLFEKQCNHLNMVFKKVLLTIKGRDLQRENEDDPIAIWYLLTEHHKGSDSALEAAGNLIIKLFQLNPNKFKSMCEFLTAYDVIIVNYDNISDDKMPNSMKLIFLKLCIRHNHQMYVAYSNWITTNRQAAASNSTKWKAKYETFYAMLREHAELLDKGSPNIGHRVHLSDSFNPSNDFDEDRDDDESISELRSYLVTQGVDPDVMNDYNAFKVQSRGRTRNGVIIPTAIWKECPREFREAWPKLSDALQHKITSLNGKSMKNSELTVYKSDVDSDAYLTPAEYYFDNFSVNQTSSYESDSCYELSGSSDGESLADPDIDNVESADDEEQLTVQKASAKPTSILRKAPGNKSHKANARRRNVLPKKSSLPVGAPIRMLAAKPYKVVDPDGKTCMTFHGSLSHQANQPRQQYQNQDGQDI